MKRYQIFQKQVEVFGTNVKDGIGRLHSLLKTLCGSISVYIQTVINREMPSLHAKDLPQYKKESAMKINIFKSKGQWYFNIKSANGKIVAQSEGYTRKHNALKTISAMKAAVASAEIVDQAN